MKIQKKTIGKKKANGTIVQRTCGWLGKKRRFIIRAWCRKTKWPDDTIPSASSACPNTCDTCSAAPTSAPTSICSDSATDKFFFKVDDNDNAVGKKCSKFHGKNEKWIQKICNIPVPAVSGYLSAKDICPETCDNCCALEIKHLENEVERYKDLLNFHNITF